MKQQNFKLKKAKLINGGGLQVIYSQQEPSTNHEINTESIDRKCTRNQHPDLDDAFKSLTEYVSKVIGLTWLDVIVGATELNPEEKEGISIT